MEVRNILEIMENKNSPRTFGISRLPYTLACAYFYLSCVEFHDKEFESAETFARDSLSKIDDLLIQDPPNTEKLKKVPANDYWLNGQEPTEIILWVRKSTLENQVSKSHPLFFFLN